MNWQQARRSSLEKMSSTSSRYSQRFLGFHPQELSRILQAQRRPRAGSRCEYQQHDILIERQGKPHQLVERSGQLEEHHVGMNLNRLSGEVSSSHRRMQVDNSGMIKLVADSHGRTPRPGSRRLGSILRHQTPRFIDLVSSMLEWDPAKRISPEDAKRHLWIKQPEGPVQDPTALRTSAQQHDLKNKPHDIRVKVSSHDGPIRAMGGIVDARNSRGPLTEAGNMQMTINKGEKGSLKSNVGSLSSMAPQTS